MPDVSSLLPLRSTSAGHAVRRACFETALAFLGGFGSPFGLILGNHDLEGDEFETDEQNLAAWHEARPAI